jgi:hypothetical protein
MGLTIMMIDQVRVIDRILNIFIIFYIVNELMTHTLLLNNNVINSA